jgi:hypothetical protein
MEIATLRSVYHHRIGEQIARTTWSKKYKQDCPNFTDVNSRGSIDIERRPCER